MLQVEVNSKDGQLQTQTRQDQTKSYSQTCYLHTGAAYPLKFKLNLSSPAEVYPAGKYQLDPSCFKTGQYGNLEMDRYSIKLVSAS